MNVELINGDCLEEMKKIPDGSIDMILCDLPYEVLNKGNKNASWDRLLPFDQLWEQYNRIIKDNGAIVLFAQGMFTAQLMMSKQNGNLYDFLIGFISQCIKMGYFPKEYLNGTTED